MPGDVAQARSGPLGATERAYVADSMRYAAHYLRALAANLQTMSQVYGSAAIERCAEHHTRAADEITRAADAFAYVEAP
jgi:hypothetical protein